MSDSVTTVLLSILTVVAISTSQQISITPNPANVLTNGKLQFTCTLNVTNKLRSVFFKISTTTVLTILCINIPCEVIPVDKKYEGGSNFGNGQFQLTIKNTPKEYHNTSVTCTAQYGTGVDSDTFISNSSVVYVLEPLTSVQLLSTANVNLQKDAFKMFTCQADSWPNAVISWKKNSSDTGVTSLPSYQLSVNGNRVTSLINYTGTVSDNGATIYCQGEYNDTIKESERTTLHIIYAPDAWPSIQMKPAGNITSGEEVILTCTVSGGNPLPELSWNCTGTTTNNTAGNISSYSVQFTVNETCNNVICSCYVQEHPVISYRPVVQQLLKVFYPPETNLIIQQNPPTNIVAGNNVTLTCSVSGGNPLATLSWNCTGINSNNMTGIIAFRSITFMVTKSNNKMICVCLATQLITSYRQTKWHQLEVYYAPVQSIGIQMVPTHKIIAGDYVTLTCTLAGGHPLATLSWNCSGNTTNTTTETTASYEVGFTVDKTYNNMICICSAKHVVQSYRNSKQHTLVVYFGPGIPVVKFTSELPWFEGNSTKLTCDYEEGNPKADIKWQNEHNNVQANDDNKLFEFHSLTRDDNGMWITCTVQNEYADIESEKVFLVVQYFPRIMLEKTYILTNESKNVSISCNAIGNPVPSIWWTINQKNLTTPKKNESVLFIGNINRTDSGNYTCKATSNSDKYGELASIKDTQVDVNYAPDVTVTKDLSTLTENTNLTLLCNASGKPPIYSYGWKHTFDRQTIRVITSNRKTLQLVNISHNDTGKYECFVNNGIGDRNGILNQTNSTDVEVHFKPAFVSYEKATTGKTGENFSASVDFIAFPDIKNTGKWRNSTDNSLLENGSNMFMTLVQKNITTELYGIRVSFDKYGYTSSLNFPKFDENQDGFYNLEVNNSAGVNNVTLRIVFSDRPEPPTLFSASVIGSTSVTLTWKEGFNGGNNQSFVLVYSKKNSADNQFIIIKEHSGTTYEVEVSDLLPSTSYIFQIKANNVEGDSDATVNNTIAVSTTYITEASSSIIGPVAGGVGGLAAAGFLVIGIFVFRRRQIASRKKTDRRNLTFTAPEESDEGLKDNELYVSAGDDFTKNSAATGDVYAVVRKPNEKKAKNTHIQETGLYAEVIKKNHQTKTEKVSKNMTTKQTGNPKKGKLKKDIDKNGDVYENMTKQVTKSTPENRNKDCLAYADLVFNDDGKRKFIIRGIDNRTDYADIDLDLKASPLPRDDSDEENGKSTEIVDLNKEK